MPFMMSSIWVFVWIGIVESCTFIVPFVRDKLNTNDLQYLPQKLFVLVGSRRGFLCSVDAACVQALSGAF